MNNEELELYHKKIYRAWLHDIKLRGLNGDNHFETIEDRLQDFKNDYESNEPFVGEIRTTDALISDFKAIVVLSQKDEDNRLMVAAFSPYVFPASKSEYQTNMDCPLSVIQTWNSSFFEPGVVRQKSHHLTTLPEVHRKNALEVLKCWAIDSREMPNNLHKHVGTFNPVSDVHLEYYQYMAEKSPLNLLHGLVDTAV